MKNFKIATILLAALGFVMLTGYSARCSDQSELFDVGAYWMPLTEGNTKTFVAKNWLDPATNEPYRCTQTVQGKETVKGIEGVKWVVTDSNYPQGNLRKGAYEVIFPDMSEYRMTMKKYFPGNTTYGTKGSYQLPTPFAKSVRYVNPGLDWYQLVSAATCFNDNQNILGQKKTINMANDTATTILTIKYMGFEDVTVPAGTFTNCMKTKIIASVIYAKSPESNAAMEMTTWSAKGIGEVKTQWDAMMMANEFNFYPFNTIQTGMVNELVSMTIN